ncbi:MAG: NFYB/HAP3 family transcription factor subunit [Candidatus Bathyarchaeota archaeon]|nr:NFYB/HAP3 family transcription factor subunit [Candidatus Bathyarchaeota archaeon]
MAEEFTIAPVRRLLKKAGDLRISPEAAIELRAVIGDYGSTIAKLAVENAVSDGRKTVLERDIKAATVKVRQLEASDTE